MSAENVERLRAVYSAIATGDLAMLIELCDPNIEVTEPPEIPDSSTYHGHDGIRAVFGKLQEVFPDMEFAAAEFIANGDRVLASMQWLGTGAGSGASARVPLFHVWSFEDGRVTRIRAFFDRRQALEAAGLPG
ncbi:MAG TPA: nuclear transport factor 2 family protein [Solirubrobacterales bacterium]|nr:nuclear transport factor 2 family protein [Solirubrobacterales bacterium]